ncbi:MAG: queuosine precursor transporter [Bacilli bacterium]
MSNEVLLSISVIIYFGSFILLFKYFGKLGLFFWIILATLYANIEVLLQVRAFGLDMTLGNVLFGSSFLATDVLSERYGKKTSSVGMRLGVITTLSYVLFSNFWLLFSPNDVDFAYEAMKTLFSPVFRIAVVSLIIYYICQKIDIFLYHYIWKFTTKSTNDSKKYLWIRNNGSTIVTQFVNNILFVYLAFSTIKIGNITIQGITSDPQVLFNIFITGWIIMTFIAIVDTPICYLCRKMKVKEVV